jgi:nucleotide-binding universal stress UspA family protein/nitroimidazol reductase NimA-like FMN-containing flavoprotein (pyridoxamine 5'-phosphate oxidase superfamily)
VSAAAVAWAADEAVRRGIGLTIVGCYALPVGHGADLPGASELDSSRRATQRRLARIAERVGARRPRLQVTTAAVGGHAGHLLVEQAADAELLVIGSSGTGDPPTYTLGSVADTAVRTSTCPVVLVASGRRPARQPIVLVIAGETAADEVIGWARQEAELLGARVETLTVEHADFLAAADAVHHADLVVLGTRRPLPESRTTPALVNAVIAHASCPVVIVDASHLATDQSRVLEPPGRATAGEEPAQTADRASSPTRWPADQAGELEELADGVVLERLRAARVARIGFSDDGQPIIIPVNVASDDEGRLVFRTRSSGSLARLHGERVAVEIDGVDAAHRRGWSILVRGVAREITEASDPTARRLRAVSVDCWAPGPRDRYFTVLPVSITSRRVEDRVDGDWFAGVPGS